MIYQPINGWTKQKMIDYIEANFKGKSINSNGKTCLYRGPEGRKCAIGLFIPDEKYFESMDTEDLRASDLIKLYPDLHDSMPLAGSALNQLQNAHDYSNKSETLGNIIQWITNDVIGEK